MIVGLNGVLASGKDTVANIIKEELPNLSVVTTSFGQHLRHFILRCIEQDTPEAFALTLDREAKDKPFRQVFDYDINEYNILIQCDVLMNKVKSRMCIKLKHKLMDALASYDLTLREVMQIVGTEVVRAAHNLTWIKLAREEIARLNQENDLVLITDVRFDNEAKLVQELKGEVWEVLRPNNPYSGTGIQGHKSEQKLPDELIDMLVLNDGTLEDLKFQVANLLDVSGIG